MQVYVAQFYDNTQDTQIVQFHTLHFNMCLICTVTNAKLLFLKEQSINCVYYNVGVVASFLLGCQMVVAMVFNRLLGWFLGC